MSLVLDTDVLLDYLSFTVPYTHKGPDLIKEKLSSLHPSDRGFGGYGYKESADLDGGGRMYWSTDNKGMGVHVSLPAGSLALLPYTALGVLSRS